jgi:NADPH:quinone reductase-like Zn-dependent oxidoreductase
LKAVVQSRYGPPRVVLALRELEPPQPLEHEVLIRVRATSVNTPDWATVTGIPRFFRLFAGLRRPKRPVRGTDVAGVVEAVGDAVNEFEPGDAVLGAALDNARIGTFAELTAVPASRLARKPTELDFEPAAACVMSGLTALSAMRDVAAVGPGTRVLINGASGGVGTFAVQIAKRLGAEVTGVCSARNLELVRSLGADHVIDYGREDFTAGEQRYDVVLDNVMNHSPRRTLGVLAPEGLFLPNSLGNTGGWVGALPRVAFAAILGLGRPDVRAVRCPVNRANLETLAEFQSAGMRVVVDSSYPLEDAAQAVERMLTHRAVGQVVITVGAPAT